MNPTRSHGEGSREKSPSVSGRQEGKVAILNPVTISNHDAQSVLHYKQLLSSEKDFPEPYTPWRKDTFQSPSLQFMMTVSGSVD